MEALQQYHEKLNPKSGLEIPIDVNELINAIQKMASHFEKVYILVDALDECGQQASKIANALKTLAEDAPTVHMCLFSREEEDIRESLADDFSRIEIAAHTEDLELYVGAEMSQRKTLKDLHIKNPQLNIDIRNSLIGNAQGM